VTREEGGVVERDIEALNALLPPTQDPLEASILLDKS